MKLLIDMNLSPEWVPVLQRGGHQAIHWSAVGVPDAPDRVILEYARAKKLALFTHDLDFGAILSASNTDSPSVIQLRMQNLDPQTCGDLVCRAVDSFREQLSQGALITIDPHKMRARILPIYREIEES